MYSGFNVDLSDLTFHDGVLPAGQRQYDLNQEKVRAKLASFVAADGKIDGGDLQEEWFPTIEADVFISHSHKNLDKAIALSGWLHSRGISSFLDSCVWGNADDLLR